MNDRIVELLGEILRKLESMDKKFEALQSIDNNVDWVRIHTSNIESNTNN